MRTFLYYVWAYINHFCLAQIRSERLCLPCIRIYSVIPLQLYQSLKNHASTRILAPKKSSGMMFSTWILILHSNLPPNTFQTSHLDTVTTMLYVYKHSSLRAHKPLFGSTKSKINFSFISKCVGPLEKKTKWTW